MTDPCQQFDMLIARSAHLSAEEAAQLEAHLASCNPCRDLARVLKPLETNLSFSSSFVSLGDKGATTPSSEANKDRYRITGEVGRGGIGRVLEALDQVLDRPVALKELFSANTKLRRRFVREALITARLQHPSIVPVYDAGHLSDRSPFYAMKLVAGHPLDKSIEEATTLAQRLALLPRVLAVADAMAYAHSKRIIHRDLKPANVLLGSFGETIVIDWGLAKDLALGDDEPLDAGAYRSTASHHTAAGAVLGTPAFMAPEQAAGTGVDERTDVYAIGAILYYVVSGATPHEGATLEELTQRVIEGDVRSLAERAPEVPRDLAAIVTKAMALAPSDRYANAGGLAEDLRRYLTGQLVASHTYGARELLRRWVKRHRTSVTIALAAFVTVAVVGVWSVVRVVHARQHAEQQRAIAEHERTNLLEEQGRQELLAGRPMRAAAYLSAAYAQRPDAGVGLRTLLAEAMRSVEAERISLGGHTTGDTAAAFSPDGTRLVTGGADRLAKIWDAATGKALATLTHDERVRTVAFSPDGARIVTTDAEQSAGIWDAHTGARLATLDQPSFILFAGFSPDGTQVITTGDGAKLWTGTTGTALVGHRGDVITAAFSPDGARVVTASADRTAKVWDTRTAQLVYSLAHDADVVTAAFSPDGTQILTASDDHTARLWTAATGTPIATLAGHRGAVHVASFSADGTRILTASTDRSAKIWDARTGQLVVSLDGHTGALDAAAFSADGTRVVTASSDRTTRLWDARTGKQLASFEGHRDDIRAASFSPDGTQILTASEDGTAKLWNTPDTRRLALDVKPSRGALSADGARFVAIADGKATLWDARTGKSLAALDGNVRAASFDPASTRFATAGDDHTATVWDAKTGKRLVSLAHAAAVQSAAFSADGTRVVTATVSEGVGRDVLVWNASTGALIATFDGGEAAFPVQVSADGARVLVASMGGGARIESVDTRKTLVELAGSANPIHTAAFSDDGERVATASLDRAVKIWNTRTGALVASLEGTTTYASGGWFSADGARLVTVTENHTAKLWDAATGKLLASYDGHTDSIQDAAFSPDGARVLTLGTDRSAKLWDERTGKLLATFEGDIVDGKFSPDGTHITVATRDGALTRWDVHLEQRKPEDIRRIVDARDPWTLANGVLIPDASRGNR